jgi:hypothetical protein
MITKKKEEHNEQYENNPFVRLNWFDTIIDRNGICFMELEDGINE